MENYLTSWKKHNVSKSDASESLRLLWQPSREVKTTAFKRSIRKDVTKFKESDI
jgi:hypothetical protein